MGRRYPGIREPPFPGNNSFGDAIGGYQQDIIRRYSALSDQQGLSHDAARWFADHRSEIETPGLNLFAQAAVLTVLGEYERTPTCVEALGALNRWPGRSGVPIGEYFREWQASCTELNASPELPNSLGHTLGIA